MGFNFSVSSFGSGYVYSQLAFAAARTGLGLGKKWSRAPSQGLAAGFIVQQIHAIQQLVVVCGVFEGVDGVPNSLIKPDAARMIKKVGMGLLVLQIGLRYVKWAPLQKISLIIQRELFGLVLRVGMGVNALLAYLSYQKGGENSVAGASFCLGHLIHLAIHRRSDLADKGKYLDALAIARYFMGTGDYFQPYLALRKVALEADPAFMNEYRGCGIMPWCW